MRMPKNLSRGDCKEIIRPYLAHELLKLRVFETTAYQEVLREYKFGAMLREKLVSSLVQSLDGEVRELGLGTRYIHDKEYVIALGSIPNANAKLRAAHLFKGKFVELAYLKLLESLSQKLASEEYGQARHAL